MENITQTARRFVRKELKGKADFETLSRYANRLGYIIKFYEPDRPDDIVKLYNLSDIAKARQALTFRNDNVKYIFINNEISPENKLHALAHELAHIILGHLDVNKNIVDYRRQDMEADAFAYTILNYRKPPHKIYALIGILSALLIMSVSYTVYLQSMGLNAPIII